MIGIRKIELLNVNRPKRRKVKVTLMNKVTIYIEKSYESWQQYGGNPAELSETVEIAQRYNVWLHNNSYCR